ncbi:MAG TPA: type II toxin-antitoxin system VapC family toxin [Terrimesophilobacter sp.]|nr:type II toxin-antitoxin system VapC family toxin [Terrimesophilobacter sp.]
MIVYIETSAAAKLLFREAETDALKAWLDDLTDGEVPIFSSILLETELRRAAAREGAPQATVTSVLEHFDIVDLDRSVWTTAGLLPGAHLRSLDALHIAVALRIGTTVMVSYDARQLQAARDAGLNTISPS